MSFSESANFSSLIIGIAGGSGSGKSTFSKMLQAFLGDEICKIIGQDSYYYDLEDQKTRPIDFDCPSSIDFPLLIEHLQLLKIGNSIQVPGYDFKTHRRTHTGQTLRSTPVILVDGILVLAQENLTPLFDYSFYIQCDEKIRFQRRLRRDVAERGRTPECIERQFKEQVKPNHLKFVEPSQRKAAQIISGERSFGPVIEKFVYGLQSQVPASNFSSFVEPASFGGAH